MQYPRLLGTPWAVVFYGVYDLMIDRVLELYVDPKRAREDLADILWDEPSWWPYVQVVAVDLSGPEAVVSPLSSGG